MSAARPLSSLRYGKVLVKLSGEALMGQNGYGIDVAVLNRIAADVAEATNLGAKLCLVVGGGNIYRGLAGAADGMDRVNGDYMGMLATVLNGIALGHALKDQGLPVRVMSAIPMPTICEPFIRARALSRIWRRARWSCSSAAPAIRFSPPTPPRRCAPPRWAATPC